MAAETGFLIDGTIYEVPALDSLTMGERRVMFELAGIVQEDFVRGEDESEEEHDKRVERLMRHPGFMEALMHVAYQRAHPSVKREKVRLLIEGTNYLEAVAAMLSEEPEEDAGPLASTTEPTLQSASDSVSSSEPSGAASTSGLGEPALHPVPTGTTRSGTSSISDPEISAA